MGEAIPVALPAGIEETTEVLADDEVVQEARGAVFCQQVPGQRDGQHQRSAGEPGQTLPEGAPTVAQQDPEEHRQAHQHAGERPLGQQAEPQSDEQQVAPGQAAQDHGTPDRHQAEGDAEQQSGVGHHRAGGAEEQQSAAEDQCTGEGGVAAAALADEAAGQQQGGHGQQQRGQPCCQFGDAEQVHAAGGEPGGQGRLGPEGHAVVVPQGDPVAGLPHLAGDLTVAGFGLVGKRECPGGDETQEQQEKKDGDRESLPAHGRRGLHGRVYVPWGAFGAVQARCQA